MKDYIKLQIFYIIFPNFYFFTKETVNYGSNQLFKIFQKCITIYTDKNKETENISLIIKKKLNNVHKVLTKKFSKFMYQILSTNNFKQ